MSNLVPANEGNALAHLDMNNVEDIFGEMAQGVGGDGTYGKFNGNTGAFTYGQTDDELEHGTQVLMDYTSAFTGWLCWIGGKPEDRKTVKVLEGKPPLEKDLPDHGPYDKEDGWGPTCGFNIMTEEGEEIILNLNSKSGDIAFRRLLGQIGSKAARNPGKLPVIELGAGSFETAKSRGKKYAPSFEIVAWETMEEFSGSSRGDDPSDYEEEAPVSSSDEGDGGIPVNDDAETATAKKATAAKDDTPPPPSRRRKAEKEAPAKDEGPSDQTPPRRRRRSV